MARTPSRKPGRSGSAVAHDEGGPGSKGGEPSPKRAAQEILHHEMEEGTDALERPAWGLLVSGLSAGLDLGFSLFLMGAAQTHAEGLSKLSEKLLMGNLYAVGFVFVILGRSELFTEQTALAVLPTIGGKASVGKLLRLWGLVWSSNMVGAALFAGMTAWVGPMLGAIDSEALGTIAHRLSDHSAREIFLGAILAGWLMGLLSWLVAAGRDTISQVVLVWLVTASIGFAGLPHVVLGAVEVMSGAFAGRGVGASDVGKFLLWATLGNAVGGTVFVAILKYGHAQPKAHA